MITVTILTKNSSEQLPKVLDALESFDEVLIFDTGSTDSTLEVARAYPNCTIHQAPFLGFGACHNQAASYAKHDWILSIDSDEVMSEELREEIGKLSLNPKTIYSIARHNIYNDKHIRWCGWYPDYQVKLYHRFHTSYSEAQVHEAVITDGMQVVKLQGKVTHTPYTRTEDFLDKMQHYSSLFAKQNKGIKESSPGKAVTHAFFTFLKSYFLKKGFLGGWEGFIISVYNANTAFYKYLKLWEINKTDK